MATFAVDTHVWLLDDLHIVLPAKVKIAFKAGQEGKVTTEDGEAHTILASQTLNLQPCETKCLSPLVDNLINLSDLNEHSILHNLRIRFKLDKIYTSVSSILISVNPFKLLPLYTPEIMESYVQGTRGKEPHVYGIGYQSYDNMMQDKEDQSVIISGESGSGKSEATKLILQFLSDLSLRAGGSTKVSEIEQQILQSNPIMESFGNAKTVRNNNSSRFGKLITIKFKGGTIIGASIVNYLLEKSRVVLQSQGERNYHIFYQLIAACEYDDELKKRIQLDGADMYTYLNQTGETTIPGVSDEKEFDDLKAAMEKLNFEKDEQDCIWDLVAAILLLGNIKYEVVVKPGSIDGSKISNYDVLEHASKLIGLDPKALEKALCSRNVGARSVILVSYSVEQAKTTRDALVKELYGDLFQWLIDKINQTINNPGDVSNTISVLDIFGFECFVTNSFEQMCINYCNEKLQFHFNEHIFRLEQEMYALQGVKVPSTDFKDNQATLDLLEAKPAGIFSMIDDELSVPKGSDFTFLNKINNAYKDHPNFDKPKPKACLKELECFGIKHYAGVVYYNANNFLEKNRDSLHPDVTGQLRLSSSLFIVDILPDADLPGSRTSVRVERNSMNRAGGPPLKVFKKTLGSQFKEQQKELMDTLNITMPHFIRCMKPNKILKGSFFEEDLMLAQLRYSGLLEVCRIRKLGFPIRRDFDEFCKRYRCIAPSCKTIDTLIAQLLKDGKLIKGQYQKGKSKVFMRNAISNELDIFRDEAFVSHAITVQKHIRSAIVLMKVKSWAKILANLKQAIVDRKEDSLTHAVDQTAELPFHGIHLSIVTEAKLLQRRLVEEKEVTLLLTNAIEQKDLDVLRSAVKAAEAMKPPFVADIVKNARITIKKFEDQLAIKAELRKAINSRDKQLLEELLLKSEGMQLVCEETRQASALKSRLEEEEETLANLKHAIQDRDLKSLSAFLAKMSEMGIDAPEITEGRQLEERLIAEIQVKTQITAAITDRVQATIESALRKATNLGLDDSCAEVAAGKKFVEVLVAEKNVIENLVSATTDRDRSKLQEYVATATSLKLNPKTVYQLSFAITMRDYLVKQNDCKVALVSAMASDDTDALSAALSLASELDVSGSEFDRASLKFASLGAETAMLTQLLSASGLKSVSDIEKLITDAESMSLGEAKEMASAKLALSRAKDSAKLIASISAASSLAELTAFLDKAEISGLISKYPTEMSAAKDKFVRLSDEARIVSGLATAMKSKDLESLSSLLSEAHAAGFSNAEIDNASTLWTQLETERDLVTKISAAIEAKDATALKPLIALADLSGIAGEKVQQGRVLVNRDVNIVETKAKIATAIASSNLSLLNEAFEMVIQLGLTGKDIDDAKIALDTLILVEAAKKELAACVKTIEVKVYSKGGIIVGDSKPLEDAVKYAASKGVSQNDVGYKGAITLVENMSKQLLVQKQCEDALVSHDKTALKAALDAATDLELNLEVKDNIKMQLKDIKDHEIMELQQAGGVAAAPGLNVLDPNALEQEREERRAEAKHNKYRFWNFSSLRSPDDFARGTIFGKKILKDGMLKWSEILVPKSLLDLTKDNSKYAINVHKCLLGYMGDKQMAFPATLAYDVLTKGLEIPAIRDEIYMQLMKQLSNNPKPESIAKGWQIMCMCVSTFPPSTDFDKYLLNFILIKSEGYGAVKNYAKYCLRTLEGMLTSGASGFVPSVEEIQAYKERPPILATIELVDGQILSEELPITPDLNVGKVAEICAHFLNLSDVRLNTLGLFVYDLPGELVDSVGFEKKPEPRIFKDLPRTPRPLRNQDFLGDIIVQKARQGRNFKFVFKKKVYLDSSNGPTNDDQYRRLVYLQAEDEVVTTGNLAIDNKAVMTLLTAMSLAYNFGDDYPTDIDSFASNDCSSFIPEVWQPAQTFEQWAEDVIAKREEVLAMELSDIEEKFVSMVKTLPYYGGHLFGVKLHSSTCETLEPPLPELLTLCFREDGLHIFNDERVHLHHFGFADIIRWGGSSRQFSLVIWNNVTDSTFELLLHSPQASDMAAVIMDLIAAIMSARA